MAAAEALKRAVRVVAEAPLTALRTVAGRRNINWTPEFMGFGNQLYLWCWAHEGRSERQRRTVLMTEKMRSWAAQVPDFARDRIIERAEVSLLDRRGHYWSEPERHTGDRRGFTERSREAFIREVLLPSPLLAGVRETPYTTDDTIVVNIRRGDFYSDPFHRTRHAIDIDSYVRAAIEGSLSADGPARGIHLVSDDISWCAEHLGWLASYGEVTYQPPEATPAISFRDVSSARRLLITNSTFSMWAAFISTVVHGDNAAKIWSPAFFMSTYEPGRCYEYDQTWSFVDELPDGWQPDWVLAAEHPAARS